MLFLVAANPGEVKRELEKLDGDQKPPWRYFAIDAASLNPKKSTIFWFTNADNRTPLTVNDFGPLTTTNIQKARRIPNISREYWKNFDPNTNKMRLLYKHVPHILYQGPLDVSKAKIVEF